MSTNHPSTESVSEENADMKKMMSAASSSCQNGKKNSGQRVFEG